MAWRDPAVVLALASLGCVVAATIYAGWAFVLVVTWP